MMQSLPIDSIPVWCPSWDQIKDKAHMYRTARIKKTGEYVSIASSGLSEGWFTVWFPYDSTPCRLHIEELCNFCL